MTLALRITSIPVDDQARAFDFYTGTLGFTVVHDIPMGEARWLTVRAPGGPDGMELLLEPLGFAPARTYQAALREAGIPCTMLGTDDLQTDHARLKAAGVVFRDAPKQMGPTWLADFDDTCGNWIRLFQA